MSNIFKRYEFLVNPLHIPLGWQHPTVVHCDDSSLHLDYSLILECGVTCKVLFVFLVIFKTAAMVISFLLYLPLLGLLLVAEDNLSSSASNEEYSRWWTGGCLAHS